VPRHSRATRTRRLARLLLGSAHRLAHLKAVVALDVAAGVSPRRTLTRGNVARPMTESAARFYFTQLIDGLSYCHEHCVCHRDLRIENLMLDNKGDLKITDFGHAGIFQVCVEPSCPVCGSACVCAWVCGQGPELRVLRTKRDPQAVASVQRNSGEKGAASVSVAKHRGAHAFARHPSARPAPRSMLGLVTRWR
jgi:hypothetical protein